MNTNVTISLDTRRTKTDGTYPLVLRVSHHRKSIIIPLGYSIPEKYFDSKQRKVKNGYDGIDSVNRLNNFILKKKAEAVNIVIQLEETGELETLSIVQLKERIAVPRKNVTFFVYTEKIIEEMNAMRRFGNARAYYSTLLAVKKFTNKVDFPFRQLSYDFLKRFEMHHLSKGNSYNGISTYLRTIRAVYNKAVKDGMADKRFYPFENYQIKTEQTNKRALSIESLRKIMMEEFAPDHPCFQARNFFLCSFFMYGINFMDMAFLTMENMVDGRIRFKRRKTGKPYDLKITPQLAEILSYYTKGKSGSDFIFPIIGREDPLEQFKDVDNQRHIYNESLKELAKICKLEEKLTSYVSRHSFATQAMMSEVPLQAISAMMGHSRLTTTEVYLKGLPSNMLDSYNERLLTAI